MLIKRLYEESDLAIEKILMREHQRLNLTSQELIILLALFSYYKRRTFSINALSKRVDFSQSEIEEMIDSLLNKGFITFYLETKEGKTREVFSLDKTFDKIEEIYFEDEQKRKMDQVESNITKAIEQLEIAIGKPLSSYELELVRKWYEKQEYEHNKIMELIYQADVSGRASVRYIERLLNQADLADLEEDEHADRVLDRIFKR